jgi:hypothetical protein
MCADDSLGAMCWIHQMFVLVLLNFHEICLKLKSGFRIIHKFPTGRASQECNYVANITNDIYHITSSPADLGSQQTFMLGKPQIKSGGNKGNEGTLEELETPATKDVKRSKSREDSVDEDSSARAERLKAKKNLDGGPATLTSKSFLSFLDSRVVSNIATLEVSIGNDIGKSIASLKELEHNRLLQASNSEPKHKQTCQLYEDETSDVDSDLGLDQHAIQHLVGDIAEDALGMEGTPWSDFKLVPRKSKSGSTKKNRGKKKLSRQIKHS